MVEDLCNKLEKSLTSNNLELHLAREEISKLIKSYYIHNQSEETLVSILHHVEDFFLSIQKEKSLPQFKEFLKEELSSLRQVKPIEKDKL